MTPAVDHPAAAHDAIAPVGVIRAAIVPTVVGRTEPDREIWRVRLKGRDDSIDLLNPRLNEQQIVEVSQQLNQVLSEEL